MAKATITRLFVGGFVAIMAGTLLELTAGFAALAGEVIEVDRSDFVEVNGGLLAWTLVGIVMLGLLAISGGAIAGVLSWIGALLNTARLESKTWFAILLLGGLLGLGVVAMVAYVLAGPDGIRADDLTLASAAEHSL